MSEPAVPVPGTEPADLGDAFAEFADDSTQITAESGMGPRDFDCCRPATASPVTPGAGDRMNKSSVHGAATSGTAEAAREEERSPEVPCSAGGYEHGNTAPGTADRSIMDDIATLAMHCKTYPDDAVRAAARRVMKLVAVQFDSSVAPLVAAVEVKELRAALAARDGEVRQLRDQLAQDIFNDETQMRDTLSEGYRPGEEYLKGYRAAVQRDAEIVRGES